jgi:hypothetical protein
LRAKLLSLATAIPPYELRTADMIREARRSLPDATPILSG